MLKKIGLGFGIFFGVLFVGGIIYLGFVKENQQKITNKAELTTKINAANGNKVKVEKKPAKKEQEQSIMIADKKTLDKSVSKMPTINFVEPDLEIEKSGKVAKEETPITPAGVLARPEFCRIIDSPTKIIKKSINCLNGFIDLTEYGLSGVEVSLNITESQSGEKYFFVCDEKDEEVKFRYVASVGDMNGFQHKQTTKLFAIGITKGDPSSYVILECPNALMGTCLFSPVIADLKSPESTRRVLAELFYLDPANIDLLVPPPSVASYLKQ